MTESDQSDQKMPELVPQPRDLPDVPATIAGTTQPDRFVYLQNPVRGTMRKYDLSNPRDLVELQEGLKKGYVQIRREVGEAGFEAKKRFTRALLRGIEGGNVRESLFQLTVEEAIGPFIQDFTARPKFGFSQTETAVIQKEAARVCQDVATHLETNGIWSHADLQVFLKGLEFGDKTRAVARSLVEEWQRDNPNWQSNNQDFFDSQSSAGHIISHIVSLFDDMPALPFTYYIEDILHIVEPEGSKRYLKFPSRQALIDRFMVQYGYSKAQQQPGSSPKPSIVEEVKQFIKTLSTLEIHSEPKPRVWLDTYTRKQLQELIDKMSVAAVDEYIEGWYLREVNAKLTREER